MASHCSWTGLTPNGSGSGLSSPATNLSRRRLSRRIRAHAKIRIPMENTFVIAWKSKAEARFGQGKRLYTREQAEDLAEELNRDYPAFLHEPLNLASAEAKASGAAVAPQDYRLPDGQPAPDNILTPDFAPAEVSEAAKQAVLP